MYIFPIFLLIVLILYSRVVLQDVHISQSQKKIEKNFSHHTLTLNVLTTIDYVAMTCDIH